MEFLPHHEFRRCVARYAADKKMRRFSCWDQWLCMAFAQLTPRESLRDIEVCLRAMGSNVYKPIDSVDGHVATGLERSATSEHGGQFLQDLPPGTYEITVARSGLTPVVVKRT